MITQFHFLLSYACTFECNHCFVYSSPNIIGNRDKTFDIKKLTNLIDQGIDNGITGVYFEGGEPFLFYPVLLQAVNYAYSKSLFIGIVSNGFWATSDENAEEYLKPLLGKVNDFSLSNDLYHYNSKDENAKIAYQNAKKMGFPINEIEICAPIEETSHKSLRGEAIIGGDVKFRGRAVDKLTEGLPRRSWKNFTTCPFEDFQNPSRVHIDSLGTVQICQGISMGNWKNQSIKSIIENYNPHLIPVIKEILIGGPAKLVSDYELNVENDFIDACHLCFSARKTLLETSHELTDILSPLQVYNM